MGERIDLDEGRVDRAAADIARRLDEAGARSLVMATDDLDVSVELWRKAARKVGRARGWKTRTGVSDDGARVWMGDNRPVHELPPEEQVEHRERLRQLVNRMDFDIGPPQKPHK